MFKLFVAFHLATGIAGGILILKASDRVADLGIALLVGALFGLGAFLAQVWSRTMDHADRIRTAAGQSLEDEARPTLQQLAEIHRLLDEDSNGHTVGT